VTTSCVFTLIMQPISVDDADRRPISCNMQFHTVLQYVRWSRPGDKKNGENGVKRILYGHLHKRSELDHGRFVLQLHVYSRETTPAYRNRI
jgi:hypothetical protein